MNEIQRTPSGFRVDYLCLEHVDKGLRVYAIGDESNSVKIGKTSGHPMERLRSLQTGNPGKLKLLAWTTRYTESQVHRCMGRITRRLSGEWFVLNEFVLIELRTWDWVDASLIDV